ncbi:MAG: CHAP domain-containing protein [Thermoleophilia bacterium]|nr:CHAP domain-containing protein [Thermoleophilia bacterium]
MGGYIATGGGATALSPTYVAGAAGTAPPTSGGGTTAAVAAPPATDLASAVAQLQTAVQQLAAAVQALQGAITVQGGGGVQQSPMQGPGCGCSMSSPSQVSQSPATPTTPPAPGTSGVIAGSDTTQAMQSDPASGDVRQRIVQVARKELERGTREDAGNNKDHAGRIREYRTAVTSPGEDPNAPEPWCADFASWVWKQSGSPFGPNGEGEDWTVAIIDKARKMGTWHQRGSYDPKPGDMVLIDWDGGSDVDHVAIVEKVENGKVYTIGGNEGDTIKNASYAIGDKRMMGFVNPPGT